MPASPWRALGAADPNGEYVALLSYLPLKSYWRIPHFFLYTAQVTKQLASAEGVLGYSVLAARCRSNSGRSPLGRTRRRCELSFSAHRMCAS
jgi:hypothetical protein